MHEMTVVVFSFVSSAGVQCLPATARPASPTPHALAPADSCGHSPCGRIVKGGWGEVTASLLLLQVVCEIMLTSVVLDVH